MSAGGTVYAGGMFINLDGLSVNYLGAVDSNGAVIRSWISRPGGFVRAIAVSDSSVYVGGIFSSIDGESQRYFSAQDPAP